MGRGLTIALIASLALNVFAVGFISGRVIGEDAPDAVAPTGRGFEPSFRMLRYADALAPERREVFRNAFRRQLPGMREQFDEMRKARAELGELLAAEEWDREAVRDKLDEIAELKARQGAAFEEAFLNAFEKLTAQERKALKQAADTRRREHPHHRRHFRDARPPNMDGADLQSDPGD